MSPLRFVLCATALLLVGVVRGQSIGDRIRAHSFDEAAGQPARDGGGPVVSLAPAYDLGEADSAYRSETERLLNETSPLRQASMLQPTPLLLPRTNLASEVGTSATVGLGAVSLTSQLFEGTGVDRSNLRAAKLGVPSLSVDLINGSDAAPLRSTDLGDLLKKSTSALSIETQSRTPIVNDSRVRDSRVGTLAASGSHWVPARADLDTALSKIDSRLVRDVIVVPGPYSSVYGPGFNFVDFKIEPSPRYAGGRETHGMTSFEHSSNGNQWLGQQSILTGGSDWGFRGTYAHRVGSNYRSGDGASVPAGYESRVFSLAMGRDLETDRSIEVSLLRLDQSDVEFPGFVFDINNLRTDGYEFTVYDDDSWIGDRTETEVWYNRTDFDGDADNPEKARQFPFLNFVDFNGVTDADVMSTGYRRAITKGNDPKHGRLTIGHDLRMIKQEVNEVFDTLLPTIPIRVSGQSPLPRSFLVNPGFFAEYYETYREYSLQLGARVDYTQTDITEDAANLQNVGLTGRPYDQVIGTDLSQTDRWMWGVYGKLERKYTSRLIGSMSLGYAQRPPTLTELYGVEQLLLLVQNGLNTMTGDPRLKTEKLLQFDASLDYDGDLVRAGMRGYYGLAFDYITFENTRIVTFAGDVVQTNLRAVNTSLATLTGFESYLELLPQRRCTPFATAKYRNGRDRTRNGDFATRAATTFLPSVRVPGLPRGAFSFIPGADSEPLPGIAPFESTVGVRFRDSVKSPQWSVELSARIVDNQDRVATSLLEFPTPGFTVWDLRAIWQPQRWPQLAVFSGVENLTDKTYREHLDFRSRAGVDVFQPGVNFFIASDLRY